MKNWVKSISLAIRNNEVYLALLIWKKLLRPRKKKKKSGCKTVCFPAGSIFAKIYICYIYEFTKKKVNDFKGKGLLEFSVIVKCFCLM